MLLDEGLRRIREGGGFFIVVDRDSLLPPLRQVGMIDKLGPDVLVNPFEPHPLKEKLFPFQQESRMDGEATDAALWANVPDGLLVAAFPDAMGAIQDRLRSSRLFGLLGSAQLENLLSESTVHVAEPWQPVVASDRHQHHVIILLHGVMEMVGHHQTDAHQHFRRTIRSGDRQGIVLGSSLKAWNAELRARVHSRYIAIEQEKIDTALAGASMQQGFDRAETGGDVLALSFLDVLPSDVRAKVESRISRETMNAGDFVIRQGDPGDSFFVLVEGEADVMRRNPFDNSVIHVANLGPGDSFGEEALLSGLTRNADVRMVTRGELLRLGKEDFDEIIRPEMVPTLTLQQAKRMVRERGARWVDCRFMPEYETGHLEGALLLPLDELRARVGELNPGKLYVVYCPTARRSAAAVFLLRERNIDAFQLAGGIDAYETSELPFERE
jgi:CRP-like cAMP-binding protein